LEDLIDRLIVECDRKITRALKRLDEEDAKAAIAISVSEVTLVIVKFGLQAHYFLLLVTGTSSFPFLCILVIVTSVFNLSKL